MLAHGTFSRRGGGYAYILLGFERGGMDLLKGFVSGRGGSYRRAFWFWFYGGVELKFLLANFFEVVFEKGCVGVRAPIT